MDKVIDLDVLRPDPIYIKLGGKKIDVSFIPCGITFDLDEIIRKMSKLNMAEVEKGGKETAQAFNFAIRICAIFCSVQHKEMTEEWFLKSTSPEQIEKMAEVIRDTLNKSLKDVEAYQGK